MVSMLAFQADNPCSNPAESAIFILNVVGKERK